MGTRERVSSGVMNDDGSRAAAAMGKIKFRRWIQIQRVQAKPPQYSAYNSFATLSERSSRVQAVFT